MVALAGQGKTRGKAAVLEIEATCNQSLAAILPQEGRLLSDFLFFNLENRYQELRDLSGGEGRAGLNLKLIKELEVLLPPIFEQKKIAEILGAVDEEIAKTDEIIAATEKLKRGLAAGFFNKKGKTVLLGDFVEIRSGDTPSGFEFEVDGMYPFYKVEDMNKSQKYLIPTRFHFNKYDKPLMPKGMVVFPKRGAAIYTNKVRILSADSYFDTNVMGLITKKGLNNEYLYYLLTHIGLSQFADTTSVAQINNKHIQPLAITLPDEKIQIEAAEVLSSVDEKVAVNMKIRDELAQLKKGLMQDLLSGKKRVI